MRVAVLFPPGPGEREALADLDAVWLTDLEGPARRQAAGTGTVALAFAPRSELRALGLTWDDFPSLRMVKLVTAGANHVGDWPAVPLCSTPGSTAPFIAEWVLGAVIAWARGMVHHTHEIKRGRFHLGAPARAVSELRVGLVGYGGIGRTAAALLGGLGATVAAVSRSGKAPAQARAPLAWLGTMDALPRLVQESDVLVLCLPLTTQTKHLVGLDLLSGMSGRPALLVNVGRGGLVKEEDLYAWLDSDATRHAAALDVWWRYPREGHPFTMPFHTLPNVVMTPHNSPNVTGFRLAMLRAAAADLDAFLADGELRHEEDPALYRDLGEEGR